MDRKIILGVLAVTVLGLLLALFSPGGRPPDPDPKLPWLIQVDEHGNSRVFGLTLGGSTLDDARLMLGQPGEISMFAAPGGKFAVEVFFDQLFLSGLRADMVLTLAVPAAQAQQMFDRGLRVSQLGSGEKKVTLAPADLALLASLPIKHLTYLPRADLDAPLLEQRFGIPAKRIAEASGVVHWLYPQRGLDIALNPDGPEALQYVPPAQFDQLLGPLEAAANAP